jgi:hypothetical protein
VFGLLFPALCDFAQERRNFVGCDGDKIPFFAGVIIELGEHNAVELNRILSRNSSCGTFDRSWRPVRVSWLTSCLGCGTFRTDGGKQDRCKISISRVQQFEPNPEFQVLASCVYRISIMNDPHPKVQDLLIISLFATPLEDQLGV